MVGVPVRRQFLCPSGSFLLLSRSHLTSYWPKLANNPPLVGLQPSTANNAVQNPQQHTHTHMNYLQIPAGYGQQTAHPINLGFSYADF